MRTQDEEDEEGDPVPKDGKHFPDRSFFIMPIVNGVYVNDSLPGAKDVQHQVFGEYSKKDMSDYSAAAYNYLMKQQEQAYNLQLWNLQNEYNSPAAQMQRYQNAGLNPNLIYGQQNVSSSPAGAQAPSFRSSGIAAKNNQNAISMIGQIMNIVKSARDTYDYMRFGGSEHAWQNMLLRTQVDAGHIENQWRNYMIGSPGYEHLSGSPRGIYQQQQLDNLIANYNRVIALTNLIPDQEARLKALKALDDYRLKILQGQNDAILHIDTGYKVLDEWLKMGMYFGMSHL